MATAETFLAADLGDLVAMGGEPDAPPLTLDAAKAAGGGAAGRRAKLEAAATKSKKRVRAARWGTRTPPAGQTRRRQCRECGTLPPRRR